MHDVDDLETDNVQGIARKYRGFGTVVLDRMVTAMRSDPRPRVRANAVTVILDTCFFGKELARARPYLLEALADPDPDVLARAADALAGSFLDDQQVKAALSQRIPALRAATSSKDAIVQAHAVSALENMGERPPGESMLRASSSGLRRRGIEQASKAQDRASVPLLVDLARHDPEVLVRMEAVPVIAALASQDIRDPLLNELVDDPSDIVAIAAIKAVGAARAAVVQPKLEAILSAPGGSRTEAAVTALADLGAAGAAPKIAAHLDDRGTDTKLSIKHALDKLVGPTRAYTEWQAWAREKGYLRSGGAGQ
jgi:HEAT repeat protein